MDKAAVDLTTFLRNVERDMEQASGTLTPETRFRELADWTSLQALIVVAGFERDYGLTLTGDVFDRAETLADLYQLLVDGTGA
jgi:acyl carrier protein